MSKGNYLNSKGFLCSSLLSFTNARNTTCKWQSSVKLIATFHPSSDLSRLSVGDEITVLPNVLTSECIPQGNLLQEACDKREYVTDKYVSSLFI